ncbi:MAG TPA: helix-turn-helix domain-containing protein [Alphaproteobacteria bacterium]|nr:helix-turn-helix domain-containing protein [Alphaproteobacteria bacterium]
MDIRRELENIGLSKNESKLYQALLELNETTTGPIIKRTNLHGSKVYEGLERLQQKGLVTFVIKENIRYFRAVDPHKIIDYLEEKKKEIEDQEKNIRTIIPMLSAIKGNTDTTHTEVYQGWKGMETVYSEMRRTLTSKDINYVIGASKGENEEQARLFFQKHVRGLAQKKIKQRIIYHKSAKGNIEESYNYPKLFEIKYMKDTSPTEINIWRDNVMIIILSRNPTVIRIKNKNLAESFVNYFEVIWKSAAR